LRKETASTEATGPGPLEAAGPPCGPDTALAALSEPARRWFRLHFGDPTPAQRLAWPLLHAGANLLLCAPTGGGKTLAAFLPILGRLLEAPPCPSVRCLYVTPLKALGNDARKNLRLTLRGLRPFLANGGPSVRVGLRTGDTPARLRRDLWRRPPDILLTTPETLALLLSRPAAGGLFAGLRWVIVDEVHALAPNKRGADLTVSLERLAGLAAREVQRIGLSATCARPAETAGFLVGVGRPCTIARAADNAPLDLAVEPLPPSAGSFMTKLVERLAPELEGNRTTLIFTNVRSLAERLAWALRRRFPGWAEQVAVHHSSLAAARRRQVERRLKQGRLRVVVSSTSLELGIDVGSVDGVVLVHPPGGVVRLLQRIGRGGHGPGRPRRGLVLTSTPAELLEAAVTGAAGRSGQVEANSGPTFPLDVLCQQLLGMAAQGTCSVGAAFALVRRAYPFRDLPRTDLAACLDYLSGRRGDGQAWLPARLRWDGDGFTIQDERTARVLRRNLGTILADEPRPVRLLGPKFKVQSPKSQGQESVSGGQALDSGLWTLDFGLSEVGQVDETFADRLLPGDRFLLDGRCLEFRGTDGPALLVEEVVGRPAAPRWGGDGWPLSAELAQRLYLLRVRAAEALRDGPAALAELLRRDYHLEGPAAAALVEHFHRQECLSEIPDAGTCLVEVVAGDAGDAYYLHTPLNRAGNDALARVAVLRLARQRGREVRSLVADLGCALFPRGGVALTPEEWRRLLAADAFEADLTAAVAGSDTLRERFRRVALAGLMLLRNPLGGRRRVGGGAWAERRLFERVRSAEPDFVLLRQAVREVREECCDGPAALAFLRELPRWPVRVRRLARVSPFAEGWTQADTGPQEVVETQAEALQRLHALLTDPVAS
jgi:ATP-dependent Lhr-like helicase